MESTSQSLDAYPKLAALQSGMVIVPADAKDLSEPQQRFLPLTEINADVAIKEAIAYIQLTQEFQTLDDASGAPVAVSFIFPRE